MNYELHDTWMINPAGPDAKLARGELDRLLARHAVSAPLYERLRRELDVNLNQSESEVAELYRGDEARADGELQTARTRLGSPKKRHPPRYRRRHGLADCGSQAPREAE